MDFEMDEDDDGVDDDESDLTLCEVILALAINTILFAMQRMYFFLINLLSIHHVTKSVNNLMVSDRQQPNYTDPTQVILLSWHEFGSCFPR